MKTYKNGWCLKKYAQKHATMITVILAAWSGMAVNANLIIVPGVDSESVVLNFTSKLANAFSTYNLIDLLAFLGLFFLFHYVLTKKCSFDATLFLTAGGLSLIYLLAFSYKDCSDTVILFGNSFQIVLFVFVFTGLWILFFFVFQCICIFLEDTITVRDINVNLGILFGIGTILIFLCRLPWLLLNYPGSIAGDTIQQLSQGLSGKYEAHHPPLSSFLLGEAVKIGELFVDKNFGVFLYLFLQAVLGSLVFSYAAIVVYKMIANMYAYICCIAFFALTPIWGLYTQWLQKDMLYSELAFLYFLFLISIVEKEELDTKMSIYLSAVGILVCLLRKNGIYFVFPSCISLLFLLKKNSKKKIAGITAITVLLVFLITNIWYPAMGIKDGNIREALSIPMQQTARYLRDHWDEVTEDEFEAIAGFCYEYESLPELYNPESADPVKDIVNTKIDKPGKYFLCWLKMFVKHPGTYISAFLNLNYGYLAPVSQNVEPDLSAEYHEQLIDMGFHHEPEGASLQILKNLVFINVVFPFLRYLTMPGFYTWVIIICVALLLKYRRKKELIPFVPFIFNILVCLASPLCNGLRYQLSIAFGMPVVIAYTRYAINLTRQSA